MPRTKKNAERKRKSTARRSAKAVKPQAPKKGERRLERAAPKASGCSRSRVGPARKTSLRSMAPMDPE